MRVLELEPSNVKALMRAAKASLALHEYEECDVCLKTVIMLFRFIVRLFITICHD